MSNRADIDSTTAALLEKDNQILFYAVKAEFDTETLRFWTGDTDITIDSETYSGLGQLLQISDIEDSLEIKSSNMTISLAGMDSEVLNMALDEEYQNRTITVLLGSLQGGTLVAQGVVTLFKGRMSNMTINDNPSGSTITLEVENRLVDLERPSNIRYTKESQKAIDSTDTCFNRVQNLQDQEIVWGRTATTGGGGGGTVGGGGGREDTRKIK